MLGIVSSFWLYLRFVMGLTRPSTLHGRLPIGLDINHTLIQHSLDLRTHDAPLQLDLIQLVLVRPLLDPGLDRVLELTAEKPVQEPVRGLQCSAQVVNRNKNLVLFTIGSLEPLQSVRDFELQSRHQFRVRSEVNIHQHRHNQIQATIVQLVISQDILTDGHPPPDLGHSAAPLGFRKVVDEVQAFVQGRYSLESQ